MAYKIPPQQWEVFFAALLQGRTKKDAAELARISMSTVEQVFIDPSKTSGAAYYHAWRAATTAEDTPQKRTLSNPARRAMGDFAYFRRRYMGRVPVPWQHKLAKQITEWLASPNREYVVINVPPGAGKTTAMRDLVCWLLVRNRALRIMWGSLVIDRASENVVAIRNEFARVVPLKADVDELETGQAFDAEATLMGDFGRFEPDHRGETPYWSARRFTIVQQDGQPVAEKEPSVTAFGFDGGYLGGRYDLCLWDDVEGMRELKASEPVRKFFFDQWAQVAENRVEPRGLFALVMQRLGATDLSRHCLDKTNTNGQPVYKHFKFPAHFDAECEGDHGDNAKPWPDGCLLDPVRLSWDFLQERAGDRSARYPVTFQQGESDPDDVLIPDIWINGGIEPETGEYFPGCWDKDRALWDMPTDLPPGWKVVMSIDPSGENYWALETWIVDPRNEVRWLVDYFRDFLTIDELLEQQVYSGDFTGKVDEMWLRLNAKGMRISHLVAEYNTLQKQIFANTKWDRWRARRGVILVPHYTTGRNKPDEEKGPQMLRDPFKHGQIRLPAKSAAELSVFISEHTNYPYWRTDDTVMANWFVELRYRTLYSMFEAEPARSSWVPSWIAGKNRYTAVHA